MSVIDFLVGGIDLGTTELCERLLRRIDRRYGRAAAWLVAIGGFSIVVLPILFLLWWASR
jgi:hypothetical protein